MLALYLVSEVYPKNGIGTSLPFLLMKVVSLHVRSNLLEGEGLFAPDGYEPRKCKTTADMSPSELNYIHMLNQNLPEDIWVLSWCPVSEEFTARLVQTLILI